MSFLMQLLLSKSPVIIDGRLLHSGRTGIGRITKVMIDVISESRTVFVLGLPGDVCFNDNVIYIRTKCKKFGMLFLFQNILLNLLTFKRKVKVIFPHYFSAFCFVRKLVMVHDLMAISHSRYFFKKFEKLKKLVLFLFIKTGLLNADIICPSRYSCDMLESMFNVKSTFLPNGTGFDFSDKSTDVHCCAEIDISCLPAPFCVGYVGNRRPHKNLSGLKRFCDINNFDLFYFDEFEPLVDHDDDLLAKFYSKVNAVALFSHCEGFGIPIIEGALFGKYIFCSKIPAFLELADIGLNFVSEDIVVTKVIRPDPDFVDLNYRFRQISSYLIRYADDK
jgi:hypothetical protein